LNQNIDFQNLTTLSTKEKILNKALELFNRDGTDAVTVRTIAKELEMSHGNLCYHYPSTDALVAALYFRLVEKLNALLAADPPPRIDLRYVFELSYATHETLYAYRFLLLDFVHVMRRLPDVKAFHRELTAQRRVQMRTLIGALITNGTFQPPLVEGQYEQWAELAILFGDFWLSSAEILYEGQEEQKVTTYHRLFVSLAVPYLTEQGRTEWQSLQMSNVQ
jgi:AcrR family transcriptional regulator